MIHISPQTMSRAAACVFVLMLWLLCSARIAAAQLDEMLKAPEPGPARPNVTRPLGLNDTLKSVLPWPYRPNIDPLQTIPLDFNSDTVSPEIIDIFGDIISGDGEWNLRCLALDDAGNVVDLSHSVGIGSCSWVRERDYQRMLEVPFR